MDFWSWYLEKSGEHDIKFTEKKDLKGTIWVKVPSDFEKRNPGWSEFPMPLKDARKYWNQLVSGGYSPFTPRKGRLMRYICEQKEMSK